MNRGRDGNGIKKTTTYKLVSDRRENGLRGLWSHHRKLLLLVFPRLHPFISKATKAPKHEHTGRLEMSNVPLFFPALVFRRCLATAFFLASFLPVLSPFQWRWRGRGSGANNVTAGESLSWVEGSVYRVNQSCTNP